MIYFHYYAECKQILVARKTIEENKWLLKTIVGFKMFLTKLGREISKVVGKKSKRFSLAI